MTQKTLNQTLILVQIMNIIIFLMLNICIYNEHKENLRNWDLQTQLNISFDTAIRNGGYDKVEKGF
jgi:hypothetical protein